MMAGAWAQKPSGGGIAVVATVLLFFVEFVAHAHGVPAARDDCACRHRSHGVSILSAHASRRR